VTALAEPESVVLSRSMARKYFRSEDVIGRTLTFNRKFPMKVTAVMEDLPSNTHLDLSILAAATSGRSNLAAFDAKPSPPDQLPPMVYVYARLREAGSIAALRTGLASIVERFPEFRAGCASLTLLAEPIAAIHMRPGRLGAMKESGSTDTAYGLALIGALVVAVAAVNFVGIASAVAGKRANEIGVRKLSGAERRHLFWQFIAENMVQVGAAMLIALAFARSTLPALNGFLQRTIEFPGDPAWILTVVAAVLVVSLAAGSYPALVLSGLRPARILKSGRLQSGTTALRSVLVGFQFSVLIGLGLASGIVTAQLRFALTQGLRFETDQVVQISSPCGTAFTEEARKVAGVLAAACANGPILEYSFPSPSIGPGGREISASIRAVDFGYFELFGLSPVAGRFFSPDFGGDSAPADRTSTTQPAVVVNEALAREMGFPSPEDALGQTISWARQANPYQYKDAEQHASQIIGVVPDFARGTVREPTPPTLFWVDRAMHRYLYLKLDGERVPETLAAIDALWRRVGDPRAISRTFLDQAVQNLYVDLTRQMIVLGYLTAVAVFIAALGLFGLAAFTAEQRTKEIGIRKSMGATSADILRLMLWQFAKPVLLANLVAWPAAYFAMRRWLDGFAYRIELEPWMFLAASALALSIALLTVIGHALLIARAHPVSALRYE
jgi:putative ABC transport system permease protein